MPQNRPRGREKNITGQGKDVFKRGDGLGTGPVGSQNGYAGRKSGSSSGSSNGVPTRAIGGGSGALILILLAIFILPKLFGGSGETSSSSQSGAGLADVVSGVLGGGETSSSSGGVTDLLGSLLGGGAPASFAASNVSSGWLKTANTGRLNTAVAPGARDKYTNIFGGGRDTVTIMVYMCGTDLESKHGMATNDLTEMTKATIADNVNVIVYTGGCSAWKNNIVSSRCNQIYKVENGGLRKLVDNDGSASMITPSTLSGFIKYCAKNYPANRNELILWDHGGGSVSGYGYDEKNARGGAMNLAGVDQALSDGGVKFDFVGFDACLMATAETALMLADHADYLIASEETEPGIGWYYTNWLTNLSKNTSLSTLEIGKNIVDDFVDECARKCAGQKTTLSVVDLAEFASTAPDSLKAFATSTSKLIRAKEFQTVSDARSGAREFAVSSKIDQVDLVHLAYNLGTDEGEQLAQSLLGAVKYNRTSSNMTNAYGLSIFFPYRKNSYVDSAVRTYKSIGMDSEYARCIQEFAGVEVSGQVAAGGSSSPLGSLLGSASGSSLGSSGDLLGSLLGSMLGGDVSGIAGLTGKNSEFLQNGLNAEETEEVLDGNLFDASALTWTTDGAQTTLRLTESQWSLVNDLALNVFIDDGEGFIDLGLDNVYDFTEDGALIGDYDGTWLAVNDQPVAYYHDDTFDDGENYVITGHIPAMVNGVRSELMLVFDNDHPYGYLAGVKSDYRDGETETVAKYAETLEIGDEIDFLCDYYDYDGNYSDTYYLGESMTYDGSFAISNVYVDSSRASAMYRFTDIYNNQYWTPVLS